MVRNADRDRTCKLLVMKEKSHHIPIASGFTEMIDTSPGSHITGINITKIKAKHSGETFHENIFHILDSL